MGIKSLLKLLRDECPAVFRDTHISEFEYEKIGVDISLYLYKYKATSGDNYVASIISLLLSLKENKTHPIVVFDGEAPKEKTEERKKRKGAREKLEEKSFALISAIKDYNENGLATPLLTETMIKINNKKGKGLLRQRIAEKNRMDSINIKLIEEMQQRIESQIITITKDDIDNVKAVCELLKVQWVQAPGEAEAFCCYMCRNGQLKGVLSEDSDIITYGSECFISNYNIRTGDCIVVDYNDVIDGLELKKEEFLDLCIMCGCDYNPNIPRVGVKTAYKLIKMFGVIENIKQIEGKTDILNYVRGREIFNTFDNKKEELDKFDLQWNGCINEICKETFREFMVVNNCGGLYSLFEHSYKSARIEIIL